MKSIELPDMQFCQAHGLASVTQAMVVRRSSCAVAQAISRRHRAAMRNFRRRLNLDVVEAYERANVPAPESPGLILWRSQLEQVNAEIREQCRLLEMNGRCDLDVEVMVYRRSDLMKLICSAALSPAEVKS